MTADPASPLDRLIAYLCERRDQIGKEWLAAIHRDIRIQASEALTVRQLQDHLPLLFEHLMDALRVRSADLVEREAAGDGDAHGLQRWEHGYRLDELIRELTRVREVILNHIFAYTGGDPEFSSELLLLVINTVGMFFDNIACQSVE
ncbi:MAG: hypothetical protein EOP84_29720, partial [Verrucomicrobiaceae bacterium]